MGERLTRPTRSVTMPWSLRSMRSSMGCGPSVPERMARGLRWITRSVPTGAATLLVCMTSAVCINLADGGETPLKLVIALLATGSLAGLATDWAHRISVSTAWT